MRINPGQISQADEVMGIKGSQKRFDDLMSGYVAAGKLVWSSPKVQTQMGAKDALVSIAKLNCGPFWFGPGEGARVGCLRGRLIAGLTPFG